MAIDFTRSSRTIDPVIMENATVGLVGCGGGRRKAELLAHAGVGTAILIDHDRVEARNPATQGHGVSDIGALKVEATAAAIRRINPRTDVIALPLTWEEAVAKDRQRLMAIDSFMIATDDFHVNRAVRQFAIAQSIDAVDAQHYPGGACVEHVVTWGDVIARNGGCGTCHTKMRLDAFEADFVPPTDIPTNIFPAELSCVQTALIVVARLHQRAGSALPIVRIAEAFQRHPFHLTRILPDFWGAPGEPFADAPDDGQAFFSRGYALDTPVGWTCPDCGSCRQET